MPGRHGTRKLFSKFTARGLTVRAGGRWEEAGEGRGCASPNQVEKVKEVGVLVRGVGKVAGSPRERLGRAGEGRGGGPVPRAASLTEW